MRVTAILVTCTLVFLTVGCEFMPGTEAYRTEQAKLAVAKLLIDPASAQFQNVVARGSHVCGEVNGRNRMGGFVGFKRFVVGLDGEDPLIDPEFDYADLLSAEDSCQALQSNSYASVSTRISACARVEEQKSTANLQALFDASWSKQCSPTSRSRIYRPPLGETQTANDRASDTTQENEVAAEIDDPADEGSRAPLVDENGMSLEAGSQERVREEGNQGAAGDEIGDPSQNELDQAFPPRER